MNDISGADSVVADATFENDLPALAPALKDRAKFKRRYAAGQMFKFERRLVLGVFRMDH